jgi:hypothetical protein
MFGSKKRILILGCSHSMGTWILQNGKEIVGSYNGWYNYLETDHPIDVYSGSGTGYFNYCKSLQKLDLDKYEYIIMQESHEPRFLFTADENWEKEKLNKNLIHYHLPGEYKLFNIRGGSNPLQEFIFDRYHVSNDKNIENISAYLKDLGSSDHRYYAIQSAVIHINYILEKAKIKSFIIPCGSDEYEMYSNTHYYCKYLDMPNLHSFWGHEKYTNVIDGAMYHLNANGNEALGKAVNTALQKEINANS